MRRTEEERSQADLYNEARIDRLLGGAGHLEQTYYLCSSLKTVETLLIRLDSGWTIMCDRR